MSETERSSRRSSRDIDIAKPRYERAFPRRVNWPWFILLCGLAILFYTLSNRVHPGLFAGIAVGVALGVGVAVLAWQLIVRRGVATWRRLAQAPARAMARGDAAQAERALAKALARARRFGPEDHRRGLMLVDLAGYVKNQGRYPEAKALFEEAVEILALHRRANALDYFIALNNFAIYFIHVHDYAAAQTMLEKVVDLMLIRKREQANKAITAQYFDLDLVLHLNLVFLFIRMDELAEARHCLVEADAIFRDMPGRRQSRFRDHYPAIRAWLLYAEGRFADAADAVALAKNPEYPACLRVRAKLALVRREFAEAEQLVRRYLDLDRKHGSMRRPELRDNMLELAESLFGQGKHDEACAALDEARAIVADFALPPDATWRRAMQSWLSRARELGRTDTTAALDAEVQALAAIPEHGITVSDRLRVRPAAS